MSDRRDFDRRRPAQGRRAADAEAEKPADVAGVFDAQLLGQDGQKRGLRGGKPVLDRAKGAYLEAEYSGAADRRPPVGLIKKTNI